MKKLGKSLSFLTKIMLVIGLLISNLSSLSIVFASEVEIDVNVVEDKLNIKYLDELANEIETVRVDVYEKYTYLDGSNYINEVTSEDVILNSYEISFDETAEDNDETVENTENELVATVGDELTVVTSSDEVVTESDEIENNENEEVVESNKEISLEVDTILSKIVFDGRYDVEIKIFDTTDESDEEEIATRIYGMDAIHKSGIEYRLVDVNSNEELIIKDGKYLVDYTSSKVRVEGRLLPGGFSPKDMLMYNETEYYAENLVKEVFTSEVDFSGRLYGEYTVPVNVEIAKFNRDTYEYDLIEFSNKNLSVLYGIYDLNTLAMNFATEELTLNETYEFVGDTKDGVVYVLLNEDKTYTMLDLYNIANYMFNDDEIISFDLSNEEYENIISTYDESTATMSLEDMLAGINLDDNTVLSLVNEGLTITYKVVFAGDINGDNVLSNEDLVEVIEQVLGNKDANVEKNDFYDKNGELNTLDVIYLNQVIKTGDWNTTITEEEVLFDSELNVIEEEIVSGDKFTVEYIVKLSDYTINGIAGLFAYDDTALQLESVESALEWSGNNNEGQFLYIGDESLELPIVEEETEDTENNETNEEVLEDDNLSVDDETLLEQELSEEEEIIVTEDYVVVKAIFTALKSGTHTIGVKNLEYFNDNVYYGEDSEEVKVEFVVNASNNNNLSTLTVAGQIIELVEGQLEYEITVGSDVTVADVEAMLENVSANITSIVSPEELVEGENIITITVTAENGDVKVYTVKVIRETSKEETTQTEYNNNYQDYNNDTNDEEDNKVSTEIDDNEEDDDEIDDIKEEESNVSRIVIIILILLVIAGLIYLIFKDEDDEETMRVNKDINRLKKEVKEPEIKKEVKVENKVNNKTNTSNSKNSNNKNKNVNKKNK